MLHNEIWRALDILAAESGLSTSGLARRAGLDPTTFNRSKRHMSDGRPRWPSTESLAKALAVTGTSLSGFASLVSGDRAFATPSSRFRPIPVIGMAQAGEPGYFDDAGFPAGDGWSEVSVPEIGDPKAYALEICGNSMQPVFRDGDMVIVSPATPVRCGDRLVLRLGSGETMAKQLVRQSAHRIELKSLNAKCRDHGFDLGEVVWMHRIIWVTQ